MLKSICHTNQMRYKQLLIFAGIVVGLWFIRCLVAQDFTTYGFIAANIFLATIPLLLQPVFGIVKKNVDGLKRGAGYLLLGIIWLLFIPNAFYILTDFMHLNADVLVNVRDDGVRYGVDYARGDGLYLLDSLLLLTATVYGAFVGGLALLKALSVFKKRFSVNIAVTLLTLIMLLSAIGVYIGRFGRWNSWEGLIMPWRIVNDLLNSLSQTVMRERFFEVVLTLMLFQYITLYCIVHLRNIRPKLP